MSLLLIISGLTLLVIGGHFIVEGAVSLAKALSSSPLLIGLTLVGFGTSMPELVLSLQASFSGSPGIAVGNIVGSIIANILLILGMAAIIFPVAISKSLSCGMLFSLASQRSALWELCYMEGFHDF